MAHISEREEVSTEATKPVIWNVASEDRKVFILKAVGNQLLSLHKSGDVYGFVAPENVVLSKGVPGLRYPPVDTSINFFGEEAVLGKQSEKSDALAFARLVRHLLPSRNRVKEGASIRSILKALERSGAVRLSFFPKLLVAALALFCAGLIGSNVSKLATGYQILNEFGPKRAVEFFGNSVSKKSDEATQFGLAWSHLRNKEFEKAEKIASTIAETSSSIYQAHALFLIGHLKSETRDFDKSIASFQKARNLYEGFDDSGNVFKSVLGIVNANFLSGDRVVADAILEEVSYSLPESNLAYYYHLRSLGSFNKADFQMALEYSELALSEDKNKSANRGTRLSAIAFYQFLTGNRSEAVRTTQIAAIEILKTADLETWHHNLLNDLLIAKCQNDFARSKVIRDQVEAYLKETSDPLLWEFFRFVDEYECHIPGSRTGAGLPDPPDDPGGNGGNGGP